MKNVIITGSNGMIGHLILMQCLEHSDIGRVTTIVRKPSGINNPKLKEIIHLDFMDYSAVKEYFKDQDLCFFCIGVYTGAVPANEFSRITVDFTKVFATTLKEASPEVSFCFLSGQGADLSEKSRILFAREKGKAENILLNLKFNGLYIFRPGYIYPVQERQEPNFAYRLMRVMYRLFLRRLYPGIGVTSVELAQVMLETGLHGGNKVIYENNDIRQLARSMSHKIKR
jgi:nucleoside-diphosphate-sugar epimerase